jgi:DNA-binding Lrp family transcriptional regulator
VSQGKKLPNLKSVDDFDEIDLQIVDAIENDPDITYEQLAEKINRAVSTTFQRVQRIRRSDWSAADLVYRKLRAQLIGVRLVLKLLRPTELVHI